jgi:hypothetical protein
MKSLIRVAFLIVIVTTAPRQASAEDFIYLNGLYCGEFCQTWMGIRRPHPEREATHQSAHAAIDAPAEQSGRAFARAPRLDRMRREAAKLAAMRTPGHPDAMRTPEHSDFVADASKAPPPAPPVRHASAKASAVALDAPAAVSPGPKPSAMAMTAPAPAQQSKPDASKGSLAPAPAAPPTVAPHAADAPKKETETPSANVTPPAAEIPVAAPRSAEPARGDASTDRTTPAQAPDPADAPLPSSPPLAAVPSKPGDAVEADRAMTETKEASAPQAPAAGDPMFVAPSAEHYTPAVLIILAGPDISALADLNGKSVVIAGLSTVTRATVIAAFAAAGVGPSQIQDGSVDDIGQLIDGKVAAAIVAFLPPDGALEFPRIPPFKTLRLTVAEHVGG